MAIRIGDCFLYKGKYYLDSRQNLPKTKEDLLNWNIPVPEGFEVFVEGNWYTFDSTVDSTDTGHFQVRSASLVETVGEAIEGLNSLDETLNLLELDFSNKTLSLNSKINEESNKLDLKVANLNSAVETEYAEDNLEIEQQFDDLNAQIDSDNLSNTNRFNNINSDFITKSTELNTEIEDEFSNINSRLDNIDDNLNLEFSNVDSSVNVISEKLELVQNRYNVLIVDKLSELTLESTWTINGISYINLGMMVSVVDDELKNGVYRLSEIDYSNINNWKKISNITVISSNELSTDPTDSSAYSTKASDSIFAIKTTAEVIEQLWTFESNQILLEKSFLFSKNLPDIGLEIKSINVDGEDRFNIQSDIWKIDSTDLVKNDLYINYINVSGKFIGEVKIFREELPKTYNKINIDLSSNQGKLDTFNNLIGTEIILTYSDTVETIIWKGSKVSFNIPPETTYTITPNTVPNYRTPEPITGDISQSVNFEYATEKINISVSQLPNLPQDFDVNFKILNRLDSSIIYEGIISTNENTPPIELLIPYDTTYTLVVENVPDMFSLPDQTNYVADSLFKSIEITFKEILEFSGTISISEIIDSESVLTSSSISQKLLPKFKRCLAKSTDDGKITICYLDADNSNLYYDGSVANLDGTEGDVMVYFPEYYYKINDSVGKIELDIKSESVESSYLKSEACLIGAYKGHILDNKLRSISGVTPTTSSKSQISNAADNRFHTGYSIVNVDKLANLILMVYSKLGTRDLVSVVGNPIKTVSSTGTTSGNGIILSSGSLGNSILGFENIFGRGEWISNLSCTIVTVGADPFMTPTLTWSTGGFVESRPNISGDMNKGILSGNIINCIGKSNSGKLSFLPIESRDPQYLIEYKNYNSLLEVNETTSYGTVNISNICYGNNGLAGIKTNSNTCEGRLTFDGEITVEENVTTFKNLTNNI